ncbi:MAG TPA: glycerophosphodiester phosphodiesterase family protein [Armatimonadota bacterium]|nr:glycerophosphodiester phosphodiesterase family protein [Armatimonadota bacterium]
MLLFGHRGGSGEAPENTVAAFAYAKGIGVTCFELDIYLSADHKLVVLHDDGGNVARTTNGTGYVDEMTVEQLHQLDARAKFPNWPGPVWVPTLEEVFQEIRDCQFCQVEIKHDKYGRYDEIAQQLVETIDRFGLRDRIIAISFQAEALDALRKVAPDIKRGYLTWDFNAPESMEAAIRLACAYAAMNHSTTSAETVKKAHDAGLAVCCWTANTREDIERLVDLGIDAITTDVPSLAMEVLGTCLA